MDENNFESDLDPEVAYLAAKDGIMILKELIKHCKDPEELKKARVHLKLLKNEARTQKKRKKRMPKNKKKLTKEEIKELMKNLL